MNKPNLQVLRDWVKELRRGRYFQGTHQLRYRNSGNVPDEYCCLGVLTNMYAQKVGKDFDDVISDPFYLSKEVREWVGPLNHPENREGSPIMCGKELSYMNDDCCSFDEIADVIEQYIEEQENQ